MPKTAVVAIGGNALITNKNRPDIPHQWDAVRETCRHLADMIEKGWKLVITHGNGPQVGYILRRSELASHEVHSVPLDLIVADTQGSIGYMLQQALHNELLSRDIHLPVVSVVTQILVNQNDPAFNNPNKPIGGFLSREEASKFEQEGWQVMEDAGRGWRRVIASPEPLEVVEIDSIKSLVDAGNIVIAAGGGGIPVVQNNKGELRELSGVYAVIDKDRASSLLATKFNAKLLLIATGVEKVALNFNTPQQQDLAEVPVTKMGDYLLEGHFAPGSMKPKIGAVIDFVKATKQPALITNPQNIKRALEHETGTWIISNQ